MEWEREENWSSISTPFVLVEAEQWPSNPELWAAGVYPKPNSFRAGHHESTAFHSREEAEAAAVDLLLKHITEMAAIIGYKVVKDEGDKQ